MAVRLNKIESETHKAFCAFLSQEKGMQGFFMDNVIDVIRKNSSNFSDASSCDPFDSLYDERVDIKALVEHYAELQNSTELLAQTNVYLHCQALQLFLDFCAFQTGVDWHSFMPKPQPEVISAEEGAIKDIHCTGYERNKALREAAIEKYGYKCSVCDFDFEKKYGAIGRGFIEVHHLNPLASVGEGHPVSVDDLRPVCCNCHSMLHKKKGGVFSIQELKALIEKRLACNHGGD